MFQVFSNIIEKKLLHQIIRKSDFQFINERNDISNEKEPLQFAMIKANELRRYPAHIHLENIKNTNITQETWIIIHGCVLVKLYDVDGSEIYKTNLYQGDATITFYGGHSYEILENNTLVYEIKSGPYLGQIKDKKFIAEDKKFDYDYRFIND